MSPEFVNGQLVGFGQLPRRPDEAEITFPPEAPVRLPALGANAPTPELVGQASNLPDDPRWRVVPKIAKIYPNRVAHDLSLLLLLLI